MDKITFGLLDNALDYLDQAAEHARKDTPRDWKYALLHLASGVELLLKAKLQEEHWSLVFQTWTKRQKIPSDLVTFSRSTPRLPLRG